MQEENTNVNSDASLEELSNSNAPVGVADTPTDNPVVISNPINTPKKSNHVMFIILGVLIISVLVVSITIFVLPGINNKQPQSNNSDIKTTQGSNESDKPSDMVPKVEDDIISETPNASDVDESFKVVANDPLKADILESEFINKLISSVKNSVDPSLSLKTVLNNQASALYKPSGADYYIRLSNASALTVTSSKTNDFYKKATEYIDSYLSSTKNGLVSFDDASCNSFETRCYKSSNLLCGVSEGNYADGVVYSVSCANLAKYSEAKTTLDGIVLAYSRGVNGQYAVSNQNYSQPIISTTSKKGYQAASVGIGNANNLFYKKDGGEWIHFIGRQNYLSCSMYNTNDLKSAFYGSKCYLDGGAMSTVSL